MFQEGLGLLAEPIEALADGFNNFIDGVGDFFTNLINSLELWFRDVKQGLNNLWNSIGQWFTNLINSIGQWFSDVIEEINEFVDSVGEWFAELFATIGDILDYLNPFSEKFFIRIAFIPSEGFIPAKFSELKEVLDDRLPIVGNLSELFGTITEANGVDSTKPKFTIDLPERWGGQTVEVINFDVIDPYIPFIKTLIRIIIWIPFLIKMYRRLPLIIY